MYNKKDSILGLVIFLKKNNVFLAKNRIGWPSVHWSNDPEPEYSLNGTLNFWLQHWTIHIFVGPLYSLVNVDFTKLIFVSYLPVTRRLKGYIVFGEKYVTDKVNKLYMKREIV